MGRSLQRGNTGVTGKPHDGPSVGGMESERDHPDHLELDARLALSAAGLLDRFHALEPAYRAEHSRWIAAATMPEARQYRIEELCEQLDPAIRPAAAPAAYPTD
jgi:uncharacterized protein YdeI (YjbR/CyaY-like superfamily)